MNRVDIKTGFNCNNRCIFCVQGNKREMYGNKDTEAVRKVLEESRKDSNSIVFTGGEVTIRQDFLPLVSYAKELGFQNIQIQSNGRMFAYQKFVDECIQAGATEFSPAVHGPNAEIHDYLTRSKNSFVQTIKGIQNLKIRRQKVITNTVITRQNYRHLPAIAGLLIQLRVDQFQFAFVHALGTAGERFQEVVPRKSLIEPYVKLALDLGRKANIPCYTEAIPYCFMKGYENHVAERIIPQTKIFDQEHIIDDYTDYRWNEGKIKGPQCGECSVQEDCEGPWKEYPAHYGWTEFQPLYAFTA